MVLKAFKFRCYPNQQQISLIQKTFGCSRFVFNQLLSEQKRKEEYWFIVNEMVQNGQLLQNNWKSGFFNKVENIKKIPLLKEEYNFLTEVDSIALQTSVENLADSFDRFTKNKIRNLNLNRKRILFKVTQPNL